MPDDDRENGLFGDTLDDNGCGCGRSCGCGCGGSDNTILIFLIVFLLLFTSFGARG